MTVTASPPNTLGRGRLITARIGLVLAGLMALPNLVNGATQLFADRQHDAETIPLWVGLSLAVAGLVTVVLLVPAWRGVDSATWAVALSRMSEISALTVFLGWFPAEDSEKPFYVVIAAVGVGLGLLVLCGLRGRASSERTFP